MLIKTRTKRNKRFWFYFADKVNLHVKNFIYIYLHWTFMVKDRVSFTDTASFLITHWTEWSLISLVGTPSSTLVVVFVPLSSAVEVVIVLTLFPREPVSHVTSESGFERAAVQVASSTSLSPKVRSDSFRLVVGGTVRVTDNLRVKHKARLQYF